MTRLLLLLVPLLLLALAWPADSQTPRETNARPAAIDPPDATAFAKGIERGRAFLLGNQNKDGSWGSARLSAGVELYAPRPGGHHAFHAAVTALCISALIEAGGDSKETLQAVERGEAWLLKHLRDVRRANADALYNVWTHGYGIRALVHLHQRLPKNSERRQQIAELIRHQMGMLERYESVDGGWGYYDLRAGTQRPASDSTSFTTAAILIALREAKSIDIEPPAKMVQRGIDSIHRQLLPDHCYLYGEYLKYKPAHPINRPGGSLGRSQCCNLALRVWGDQKITEKVLASWLDLFFARHGWLDMARKRPIPHESHFAVAGYFFYFGHYYAALCLEELPIKERPFYQHHLARVLLERQEKDGSWWDFPLYDYHRQYGTAFALMSLQRCRTAEAEKKVGGS